jgi:hypothetical protein
MAVRVRLNSQFSLGYPDGWCFEDGHRHNSVRAHAVSGVISIKARLRIDE